MSLATTDIFKTLCHKNNDLIQLSEEDLKKVQEKLLEMATDVIEVLEENNCVYHLTGGSALGAIRHKGFIPWDDDIDIDISRESLSVFMAKFKEKHSDKYWIHDAYNKNGHTIPAIQIRMKNTLYVSINDFNNEECGLPLDLVIMENTFDNKILRNIHGIGSLALGLIVSCRKFAKYHDYFLNLVKDYPEAKRTFEKKIFIGKLVSFFSLERWTILYDKWNALCKNSRSKYVVVPTGRKHFFGEMYEREKFYKTRKADFNGNFWDIPYDYDYYLKKLYGDYMVIPPVEKREKHVLVKFDVK